MNLKRILVPVDYSACSTGALKVAAELASKLDSTLDIVHVWDRPSYVSDVVMTTTEPVSSTSLIRMIQENAQKDLLHFLNNAQLPSSVSSTSRLISGDPASSLLQALKDDQYDLVVMGTHGRTGLSRLLLGSVAEKLVRMSAVPVLTVPDEAAQKLRA
jgi:universal stress protein A